MRIAKVISGGQTGADRAALDAAIAAEIPHGGWCPRGRIAEDGRIADRYQLRETSSNGYPERTRMNVADADATLILFFSGHRVRGELTGGTRLTEKIATGIVGFAVKPCLSIDPASSDPAIVTSWLTRNLAGVRRWERGATGLVLDSLILNVAGPRESKQPGIYAASLAFMASLLSSLGRNEARR